METLKDILWPIVLVGGFGAFINFLIGTTGQEKAKNFLLKWWVRFDDVHWRNFGREEGLFAGQLIERWFGKRFWSWRRIVAAVALSSLFLLIGFVIEISNNIPVSDIWDFLPDEPIVLTGSLVIILILVFYHSPHLCHLQNISHFGQLTCVEIAKR
jgi:hypothetical protein